MTDKYRPIIPNGAHLADASDGEGKRGLAFDDNGKLVSNVKWIQVDDENDENMNNYNSKYNSTNKEIGAKSVTIIVVLLATILAYEYGQHKKQVNDWVSDRYMDVKNSLFRLFKKENTDTKNYSGVRLRKKIMDEPKIVEADKESKEHTNDSSGQEYFVRAVLLSEALRKELENYYEYSAKRNGTGPLSYEEYCKRVDKLTKENIEQILKLELE
jgi:hypothetical protein